MRTLTGMRLEAAQELQSAILKFGSLGPENDVQLSSLFFDKMDPHSRPAVIETLVRVLFSSMFVESTASAVIENCLSSRYSYSLSIERVFDIFIERIVSSEDPDSKEILASVINFAVKAYSSLFEEGDYHGMGRILHENTDMVVDDTLRNIICFSMPYEGDTLRNFEDVFVKAINLFIQDKHSKGTQ